MGWLYSEPMKQMENSMMNEVYNITKNIHLMVYNEIQIDF